MTGNRISGVRIPFWGMYREDLSGRTQDLNSGSYAPDPAIAAHRHTSAKAAGAPSEFAETRLWIAAKPRKNKPGFTIDL
jgi:hypothetical protein